MAIYCRLLLLVMKSILFVAISSCSKSFITILWNQLISRFQMAKLVEFDRWGLISEHTNSSIPTDRECFEANRPAGKAIQNPSYFARRRRPQLIGLRPFGVAITRLVRPCSPPIEICKLLKPGGAFTDRLPTSWIKTHSVTK